MKKLRQLPEIWRLVRSNWKTLAVFELFYKLAVAVLFIPLLSGSAAAAMRLTGYAYLTVENVRAFAVHPLTVGLVLVLLIFGTMLVMIDIGAVL